MFVSSLIQIIITQIFLIVIVFSKAFSLPISLAYSLTYSLAYSLPYSLAYSLANSLAYSLAFSLAYSIAYSCETFVMKLVRQSTLPHQYKPGQTEHSNTTTKTGQTELPFFAPFKSCCTTLSQKYKYIRQSTLSDQLCITVAEYSGKKVSLEVFPQLGQLY